ncbi:MAG: antibiotic biosynthesis monooxygenase [Proteobacteria bacterium]|nr:antibiotic biosynthesis monooxygenase [Desulfobacula sp.]MBU3952558.1 antibiotic biosynthesis monooxygenase [Pseudomonadota bacterium]MBU4130987.1 antibiotic biosynthesis monooxygenase [Pseudomonadota bacterium]
MIIVRIILNVLPDKQLEITQTLVSLIEPVSREKGCKDCSIFCDIQDKNRLCLIEEWQAREDLDLHIKSHRFGVLLGTKPLLSEPLNIRIYTVSHLQGMKAIETVRTQGVPYDEYFNKSSGWKHSVDLVEPWRKY